jgi:hypothetical protein
VCDTFAQQAPEDRNNDTHRSQNLKSHNKLICVQQLFNLQLRNTYAV